MCKVPLGSLNSSNCSELCLGKSSWAGEGEAGGQVSRFCRVLLWLGSVCLPESARVLYVESLSSHGPLWLLTYGRELVPLLVWPHTHTHR